MIRSGGPRAPATLRIVFRNSTSELSRLAARPCPGMSNRIDRYPAVANAFASGLMSIADPPQPCRNITVGPWPIAVATTSPAVSRTAISVLVESALDGRAWVLILVLEPLVCRGGVANMRAARSSAVRGETRDSTANQSRRARTLNGSVRSVVLIVEAFIVIVRHPRVGRTRPKIKDAKYVRPRPRHRTHAPRALSPQGRETDATRGSRRRRSRTAGRRTARDRHRGGSARRRS